MKTKTLFLVLVLSVSSLTFPKAQESLSVSVNADVVSTYIWRGLYQAGLSIQPALNVGYSGFQLTAWGSTDLKQFKEFDLTLAFQTGGLTLSITDYWWAGQGQRYFDQDLHFFEGTVAYHFGDNFPLSLAWSTMFSGEGDRDEQGEKMYSSYVEAAFDCTLGDVSLRPALGLVPWGKSLYHVQPSRPGDVQMTQVSLKATKSVQWSEALSTPVFAQVVISPYDDNVHFVLGISF